MWMNPFDETAILMNPFDEPLHNHVGLMKGFSLNYAQQVLKKGEAEQRGHQTGWLLVENPCKDHVYIYIYKCIIQNDYVYIYIL